MLKCILLFVPGVRCPLGNLYIYFRLELEGSRLKNSRKTENSLIVFLLIPIEKLDVKNYVKKDVKNGVKNDVKNDIKNDVKNYVKKRGQKLG